MIKRLALLAGAALAALALAAIATAHTLRARAAAGATVELRETALGKVLVNSAGFTVFEFTKDKKNKDACVTISGCTEVWPPLEVTGTPTAGTGVNGKMLKTIKLPSGASQVTYDGRPLYLYVGDSGPGETSYVGAKEFGGTWYALNAKGKKVKQARTSGW